MYFLCNIQSWVPRYSHKWKLRLVNSLIYFLNLLLILSDVRTAGKLVKAQKYVLGTEMSHSLT